MDHRKIDFTGLSEGILLRKATVDHRNYMEYVKKEREHQKEMKLMDETFQIRMKEMEIEGMLKAKQMELDMKKMELEMKGFIVNGASFVRPKHEEYPAEQGDGPDV